MDELIEILNRMDVDARRVVELMCSREVVVQLATNQEQLHQLHPRFEMLANVGNAIRSREVDIAQVARGFDAVCDPAIIPVVE